MAVPDRVLISCRLVWDVLDSYRDLLTSHAVEWDVPNIRGQQMEEADLLPVIGGYTGILAGDDRLTRRVLEEAKVLRVVSKWGVGVDAIDLDAAAELGITVSNTPGVFADELADYALGYLILLARRQHEVDRKVRTGLWHKVRGRSLAGRTLGIIGLGSSGRELARRAASMRMAVLGNDIVAPGDEFLRETGCRVVGLDELLSTSDVVSLHLPADEATIGLLDRAALARMKPGAWLINTSRGSLVDETALIEALASGALGAAALDVFQQEPLSAESPLVAMPNVILGSHNGSNTEEAVMRTTDAAIHNLLVGLGKVAP